MKLLNNKHGYILGATMIILVIFMGMGIFIIDFTINETTQVQKLKSKEQARYIARTGAMVTEQAIIDISKNDIEMGIFEKELAKGVITSFNNEFANGYYDINIEFLATGELQVTSIGNVREEETKVVKIMTMETETIENNVNKPINFDLAMFSDSNMTFSGSGKSIGDIGSNAIITGGGGAIIDGDSYVLKKSNFKALGNWKDYKEIKIAEKREFELPLFPIAPENLTKKADIKLNWATPNVTINSNGEYNLIENPYKSGLKLTIDTSKSDIHIKVKSLIMKGTLEVIGNNQVHLYVDKIDFSGEGEINNNRSIADRKLVNIYYYNSEDLNLNANVTLNGSLYVDKANMNINGSTKITGNIVTGGKKATVGGATKYQEGVIYGPRTDISLIGGITIKGAVVGKSIISEGNATVIYAKENTTYLPVTSETTIDFVNGKTIFKQGYFK